MNELVDRIDENVNDEDVAIDTEQVLLPRLSIKTKPIV